MAAYTRVEAHQLVQGRPQWHLHSLEVRLEEYQRVEVRTTEVDDLVSLGLVKTRVIEEDCTLRPAALVGDEYRCRPVLAC